MPIHEMERLAGLYLSELMQDFLRRPAQRDGGARPHCPTPEPVIDILCSKAFTHLSQTRSMPYRARIAHSLQADLAGQRPLRFFYDLGPGYHAALELNNGDLRFTPGLGELLALWQILRFARCVERVYPAGVRFGLVIDDLCAWVANDVALDSTWTYLRRLEALIRSVG
ncbi:MAG: hypothetical protein RIS48_1997, partial [Pseudomonadota bacterium]